MPNEREKELIKELSRLIDMLPPDVGAYEAVAYFILTREKSLAKEIVKPLKRIGKRTGYANKMENPETGNEYYWDDVKESISIASKIINGG